jgi:hypothetical protein
MFLNLGEENTRVHYTILTTGYIVKFFKIKSDWVTDSGSHTHTHIYCLEQHKLTSVQGKICPFVLSPFLFEGRAHTLGRGTDTGRERVHNESSRQKSLLLREILIGAYPCS